jgi:hypothetical protein
LFGLLDDCSLPVRRLISGRGAFNRGEIQIAALRLGLRFFGASDGADHQTGGQDRKTKTDFSRHNDAPPRMQFRNIFFQV